MKKILIAVITIIMSLLLILPAYAEDKLRVIKVLSNFEAFNTTKELWDSENINGYIYAFQSTESKGEIVNINGDKMVKCTFAGITNQYTHWHTWTYKDTDSIIRYKPDGIRFYIKTEENELRIMPRLDFNASLYSPARVMIGSTNLYTVDKTGKTKTSLGTYSMTIPANFEGYLYFPFNKPLISLAGVGTPTLTINEWETIDNFVFFAQSTTGGTFNKPTVAYFDDFEFYTYRDVSQDAKFVMTEEPGYTITPIVPHTLLPGQTAQPTQKTSAGESQVTDTSNPGQTGFTSSSPNQTSATASNPNNPDKTNVSDPESYIVIWIIAGVVVLAFILGIIYLLIKKKKIKSE